ncbi:MAG: hypothetical protein V7K98_08560 [Nostoc sp.]
MGGQDAHPTINSWIFFIWKSLTDQKFIFIPGEKLIQSLEDKAELAKTKVAIVE